MARYDYRADLADLGVSVATPPDAGEQWIVFGLSWVEESHEGNAANPWLMGDPVGDREGASRPRTDSVNSPTNPPPTILPRAKSRIWIESE